LLQVRDIVQYTDTNGVKRLGQVIRDNLDNTYQVQIFDIAGRPDAPMLVVQEGTGNNQAALLNQGGYRTVFDIDLSQLSNQTFPSDATGITFAGASGWNMINSANCTTVTQLINGTGLRFNPVAATNVASPRTAPALGCLVQSYAPTYNYLTDSLRFWTYISADNCVASFDHAYSGFWSHTGNSTDFICVAMRGVFSGTQSLRVRECFKGTVTDSGMAQNLAAGNRVIITDLTPSFTRCSYGAISGTGTFQAFSSMAFAGQVVFSGAFFWDNPTVPPNSADFCFGLGALRAASGTNLIIDYKRMKLEIAQQ